MEYAGHFLLLMCVLVIGQHGHVAFSQIGMLGWPCVTSGPCREVNANSECNQEKGKCLCIAGYGYDELHFAPTCNPYPFHNVRNITFEMDAYLNCMVQVANLTEIRWFRKGRDLCTSSCTWCSQGKTTSRVDYNNFLSQLIVRNVIRDDTYTCEALTSDGKTWTVSNTEIVVVPNINMPIHLSFDLEYTIYCSALTPNLQFRLVRDGNETCTLDSTWCSQENHPQQGSSYAFKIRNLRANHTFTCEVYSADDRMATMAVYNAMVGPRPKILELTISPTAPVKKGTEVVATVRFQSLIEDPMSYWRVNGVLVNDSMTDNLIVLPENEYEKKASFGPLYHSTNLTFAVRNMYGTDKKQVQVTINGAVGVYVVQKETVTFALAALLTLFRSMTFNA